MKKVKFCLFDCFIIALVGILIYLPMMAQDTDTIAASVTAKYSAVTVSDGSVDYGSIAWSGSADTDDLSQSQTMNQ